MAGMFGAGLSGLNAAQLGLITTSHNISNANTPGFSRQQTVQSTGIAQGTGAGFLGSGTTVNTVRRQFSSFLSNQVLSAQTQASYFDSYTQQIQQLDNMLADPSAGLSPTLQDFFRGVQDVANFPASVPARQSMISAGQALAARFHAIDQRLREIDDGVTSEIRAATTQINSAATQIAELNQKIALAEAIGNQPPNDLLDQRDNAVRELNKLVQAKAVVQNDGSYSVFIGTGQALVIGPRAEQLVVQPSNENPSRYEVGIKTVGAPIVLNASILPGGTLGGLLKFRDESLDPSFNALGRVAAGLTETFNAQQRLGQDLNGALGTNFFQPATTQVYANSLNTGTGVIGASIANVNQLVVSDYRVSFTGGNYTITRLTDSTVSGPFAGLPQTIDGVTFNLSAGAPAAGDTFLVQPTRVAAQNFNVILTDTAKIAAAAPIKTAVGRGNLLSTVPNANNKGSGVVQTTITTPASLVNSDYELIYNGANYTLRRLSDNTTTTLAGLPASQDGLTFALGSGTPQSGDVFRITRANQGTGTISAGSVSTVGAAPLASSISMTYNSGTNQFSVTGAAPATFAYSAGQNVALTVGGFTINFAMNGAPANGDTFYINPNTSGGADSRNALLLGGLQTQNTLAGGTANYQGAYSQLVSTIGSKSNEVEVTGKAQSQLLVESDKNLQAFAGVNLDEEAANLIRYQQAYQASGKVLQIASALFNEILGLGRG